MLMKEGEGDPGVQPVPERSILLKGISHEMDLALDGMHFLGAPMLLQRRKCIYRG